MHKRMEFYMCGTCEFGNPILILLKIEWTISSGHCQLGTYLQILIIRENPQSEQSKYPSLSVL